MLFFGTISGHNVVLAFDRTMTPFGLTLANVPRQLFECGALLDAELARPRAPGSGLVLLVFDALVVAGCPVWTLPWSECTNAARIGLTHHSKCCGASERAGEDPVALEQPKSRQSLGISQRCRGA